jgi:hypothetical protein
VECGGCAIGGKKEILIGFEDFKNAIFANIL